MQSGYVIPRKKYKTMPVITLMLYQQPKRLYINSIFIATNDHFPFTYLFWWSNERTSICLFAQFKGQNSENLIIERRLGSYSKLLFNLIVFWWSNFKKSIDRNINRNTVFIYYTVSCTWDSWAYWEQTLLMVTWNLNVIYTSGIIIKSEECLNFQYTCERIKDYLYIR